MKKILLCGLLCIPGALFAQDKIEQYCELLATGKLFSNKVTIDVDFGEERKFFSSKDNRIKDELGKVKTFNSVVAALNYMGSIGWKFVDAFPIAEGTSGRVLHFYFRKEFDKSELIPTEQQ